MHKAQHEMTIFVFEHQYCSNTSVQNDSNKKSFVIL